MSISFNALGSLGRLGNQMFQYAALRGIASYHGYDWMIPPPNHRGKTNYGLFDCFVMASVEKRNLGLSDYHSSSTGQFKFSKSYLEQCKDNVDLIDYFQSEKYFKNVEPLIRTDYSFKVEILAPCKRLLDSLDDPVFLHVRRGDYINQQKVHPVCPLEYYEKALSYFAKDKTVLILSDDIAWCKKQALFSAERFLICKYEKRYPYQCTTRDGPENSLLPYRDLCLMTLCRGGIMANSSMSWWGCYLQEDAGQTIITPERWFGPAYRLPLEDLHLKSWIKI